jgi:hypothetical protein
LYFGNLEIHWFGGAALSPTKPASSSSIHRT